MEGHDTWRFCFGQDALVAGLPYILDDHLDLKSSVYIFRSVTAILQCIATA